MSSRPAAVRVVGLGKAYARAGSTGAYRTLREDLGAALTAPLNWLKGRPPPLEPFWAVQELSFEVSPGEVLGVIGRNGAGKTTLLRLLSRITEPTCGRVELRGRLGCLLEVGTGFHPELSGRENILLSGAVLGMSRKEVLTKLTDIVDFAEVGEFLHLPVKRYSSGMYVRLAFAVAAHLEPEILLLDEVLAVGDAGFQRKCMDRIRHITSSGRTILLVSHAMSTVEALCQRTLVLERGRGVYAGSTAGGIRCYQELLRASGALDLRQRTDREGTGAIRFTSARWLDAEGLPVTQLAAGAACALELELGRHQAELSAEVSFAAALYHYGTRLVTLAPDQHGLPANGALPASFRLACRFPRLPLAPGTYQLNIVVRVGGEIADWITEALELEVLGGDFHGTGGGLIELGPPGVLVDHAWELTELAPQ